MTLYIYETQHHLVFTSVYKSPPTYVCTGVCKCISWREAIDRPHTIETVACDICGGNISYAKKGEHYRKLKNIPARFDDARKELEPTISLANAGLAKLNFASYVKPEFEDLAKREWLSKK